MRLLRPLAMLLVLAALGLLVYWTLNDLSTPPTAAVTVGEAPPRYTLHNALWTRYDERGRLQVSARAEVIDYYDDESARLERLDMRLPSSSGVDWTLTAPSGYAAPHSWKMNLDGPVDGTGAWPSGEPVNFHTPQLWVDFRNNELSTDSGVRVDSPSRRGTAQGLRGDWEKQKLQLLGQVGIEYGGR